MRSVPKPPEDRNGRRPDNRNHRVRWEHAVAQVEAKRAAVRASALSSRGRARSEKAGLDPEHVARVAAARVPGVKLVTMMASVVLPRPVARRATGRAPARHAASHTATTPASSGADGPPQEPPRPPPVGSAEAVWSLEGICGASAGPRFVCVLRPGHRGKHRADFGGGLFADFTSSGPASLDARRGR